LTPDGASDLAYLDFILEAIDRIEHYTGGGRAAFFDDTMVQDSDVSRALHPEFRGV